MRRQQNGLIFRRSVIASRQNGNELIGIDVLFLMRVEDECCSLACRGIAQHFLSGNAVEHQQRHIELPRRSDESGSPRRPEAKGPLR